MSPPRPPRPRLIAAAAALLGALALAIAPGLAGPPASGLFFLGGVAVALLLAGMLLRHAAVVMVGVGVLGGEFVIWLYLRETPAIFAAAIYGSALLLVAEIALWSIEMRARQRGGTVAIRHRALAIVLLAGAALAAGLSTAAIARAPLPGSLVLTVVGIGGLLAAIALVAVVLWKASGDAT